MHGGRAYSVFICFKAAVHIDLASSITAMLAQYRCAQPATI